MADAKNWTWVLERACPECGFDATQVTGDQVGALVRRAAADLVVALSAPDCAVRPEPEVWSALEYACHVRDVCTVFDERLALMLQEDDPAFANWDQDATAEQERYGEQDPSVVAGALHAGAGRLAAAFDAVSGTQWQRTGRRSDGSRFTVLTLGQYLVHDPLHHVWDVTGVRQVPA